MLHSEREVADGEHVRRYAVRVRRRRWFGLWTPWRSVQTTDRTDSWPAPVAREVADGCLENGWIEHGDFMDYYRYAEPILTVDDDAT